MLVASIIVVAVCIILMQRPGIRTLFSKKSCVYNSVPNLPMDVCVNIMMEAEPAGHRSSPPRRSLFLASAPTSSCCPSFAATPLDRLTRPSTGTRPFPGGHTDPMWWRRASLGRSWTHATTSFSWRRGRVSPEAPGCCPYHRVLIIHDDGRSLGELRQCDGRDYWNESWGHQADVIYSTTE